VLGRSGWRQRSMGVGPTGRIGPAMTYDRDQRAIVLFSGSDRDRFGQYPNDTWVLERRPVEAPQD
jgi:hypothetical protein